MVEVPESLLDERRRTGADGWDEVWDGVLHMAPAPTGIHQRFGWRLAVVLHPRAEAKGLVASYETALYRPDAGRADYRVPDQVFCQPAHATARGMQGRAELVVEIRSPGDETYDKPAFYAEVGCAGTPGRRPRDLSGRASPSQHCARSRPGVSPAARRAPR